MDHLVFSAGFAGWLSSVVDWFTTLTATPAVQSLLEHLPHILVAMGLGSLIGLERWLKHKVAGVRTHMVISTSACLVTILGVVMSSTASGSLNGVVIDATRLAHGILAGIGFVGAGVILRRGMSTQGVTTAATILLAASLGIASGFGFFLLPTAATVLLLLAMYIADKFMPTYETGGVSLEVVCPIEKFAEAKALMGEGARIDSVRKIRGKVEFRAHTAMSAPELNKLLETVVGNNDVDSVEVVQSCPND